MNNKGLDNKGFTLVELLAVILILLSISLVAIPNMSRSLKRNANQEVEMQEKIAINAAKIYFYEKNTMANLTYVKIQTLIDESYVDAIKIDKLDVNKYVIICVDNNEYQIDFGTACRKKK